jgi:hypothetical protein
MGYRIIGYGNVEALSKSGTSAAFRKIGIHLIAVNSVQCGVNQ